MKLRISGNSVRIRLRQAEVAQLAEGQVVEQSTFFSADSSLDVSVSVSSSVQFATATFVQSQLRIVLPASQAVAWAKSEAVSIESVQQIGDGRQLQILIEKDFECLHRLGPDDADCFPNPLK